MNLLSLQQQFGTDPAYIYTYTGNIPNSSVNAYITEKFAQAAGTNLISCIITRMQSVYLVYTKNDYNINSNDFNLLVTLPIVIEIPQESVDNLETVTVEEEIQGNI